MATASAVPAASGNRDNAVRAAHTAQTLKDLGFPLEWHSYPMAHQVCAEELEALGDWLDARFRAA